MSRSDEDLLGTYLEEGSQAAFAELVVRHAGLVHGTCMRHLGNPHDAEDVGQECFLELARCAQDIRGSLVGWLHTVAHRRSIDFLRRAGRRRHHEGQTVALPVGDEAVWSDLEPYVDAAIAELEDSERRIVIGHLLEGRTQSDLAREMAVDQATVSRRLDRGLDRIRAHLQKNGVSIAAPALLLLFARHAIATPPVALLRGPAATGPVESGDGRGAETTWPRRGRARDLLMAIIGVGLVAVVWSASLLVGQSVTPNGATDRMGRESPVGRHDDVQIFKTAVIDEDSPSASPATRTDRFDGKDQAMDQNDVIIYDLTLKVGRYEEMVDFYRGLGLPVIHTNPRGLTVFDAGGMELALHVEADESLQTRNMGISLVLADYDTRVEQLRAGGLDLSEDEPIHAGFIGTHVRDPDGHTVSLFRPKPGHHVEPPILTGGQEGPRQTDESERIHMTGSDTPENGVTGLATVAVFVADIEAAKRFYIDVLGFCEEEAMPPGVFLSAGEASVYLEGGKQPSPPITAGSVRVSPAFEVASVKSLYDSLRDKGVRIVEDYQEFGPEFALFKAADPDGNIFEIAGAP